MSKVAVERNPVHSGTSAATSSCVALASESDPAINATMRATRPPASRTSTAISRPMSACFFLPLQAPVPAIGFTMTTGAVPAPFGGCCPGGCAFCMCFIATAGTAATSSRGVGNILVVSSSRAKMNLSGESLFDFRGLAWSTCARISLSLACRALRRCVNISTASTVEWALGGDTATGTGAVVGAVVGAPPSPSFTLVSKLCSRRSRTCRRAAGSTAVSSLQPRWCVFKNLAACTGQADGWWERTVLASLSFSAAFCPVLMTATVTLSVLTLSVVVMVLSRH